MSALFFSKIEVTRQAFYRTPLAAAIVNLKPIVPGHVLVISARPVPRISDLSATELGALMASVQRVGRVIESAYGADALTVACQDGKAAGQSIPHVHFHILPRKLAGDRFSGAKNDEVYPALERAGGTMERDLSALREKLPDALHKTQAELARDQHAATHTTADTAKHSGAAEWLGMKPVKMDADEDRPPRTMEEMEKEAEWLRAMFNPDERD